MAGIGFELRKILSRNTYTATLQAYFYAGVISSGPWVLSILTVMLIGMLSLSIATPSLLVRQFLVSVTYLMAGSLILTGGFQIFFTRFVSDRYFENNKYLILPNLLGVIAFVTLLAVIVSSVVAYLFFLQLSPLYIALMMTNFVVLCNFWMVVIFLSSMKAYHRIVGVMVCGYSIMLLAAWFLRIYDLPGLLCALLIGHSVLFFAFLFDILREYPAKKLVDFTFLDRKKSFYSLVAIGFFYNVGIWIDKIFFWFNPMLSEAVIGPLRASVLYDLPIFMAYLTIIPGMAVFLVRIETDFVEWYDRLFSAIRGGQTLQSIMELKEGMILSIRHGLIDICKVQGFVLVILLVFGPHLLHALGVSEYYLPLFYILVVGVGLQVVFMALLNIFFYLDERRPVLFLSALFLVLNALLTWLSQLMGPSFYGYGFTVSLAISCVVALHILNRLLDDLEYDTFMQRH